MFALCVCVCGGWGSRPISEYSSILPLHGWLCRVVTSGSKPRIKHLRNQQSAAPTGLHFVAFHSYDPTILLSIHVGLFGRSAASLQSVKAGPKSTKCQTKSLPGPTRPEGSKRSHTSQNSAIKGHFDSFLTQEPQHHCGVCVRLVEQICPSCCPSPVLLQRHLAHSGQGCLNHASSRDQLCFVWRSCQSAA